MKNKFLCNTDSSSSTFHVPLLYHLLNPSSPSTNLLPYQSFSDSLFYTSLSYNYAPKRALTMPAIAHYVDCLFSALLYPWNYAYFLRACRRWMGDRMDGWINGQIKPATKTWVFQIIRCAPLQDTLNKFLCISREVWILKVSPVSSTFWSQHYSKSLEW